MARQYVFVCDGCQTSKTSLHPGRPPSWSDARVVIIGLTNWRSPGGPSIERSFLLCPDCQLLLQDACEPKNWHRAAPEQVEPETTSPIAAE